MARATYTKEQKDTMKREAEALFVNAVERLEIDFLNMKAEISERYMKEWRKIDELPEE